MASHSGTAAVGLLLPVFVFGLIIYSWYAYVFRVCRSLLLEPQAHVAQAVAFIVIACIFWLLTLITYLRILFSYPGKATPSVLPLSENTPQSLYAPQTLDTETTVINAANESQAPNEATSLIPAVSVCRPVGMPRYCDVCKCYKPDRTHHCSQCNTCILKMDHHCPWINGCVGFRNYKFFFLFVLYAALYSMWLLCSTLPLVLNTIQISDRDVDPEWMILLAMSFIFGLTLCGFAGLHLYYILVNVTTIEHISHTPLDIRVDFDNSGNNYEIVTVPSTERLWDLGMAKNWRATMGNKALHWFVPITGSPGNGSIFPYNPQSYAKLIERAKHQRATRNTAAPAQNTP